MFFWIIIILTLVVIGGIVWIYRKVRTLPIFTYPEVLHESVLVNVNKRQLVEKVHYIESSDLPVQRIPRTIIQTNESDELSAGLILAMDNIRKYNPEYKHLYFNDDDCADYISQNFDERTFSAFQTLVPGAFKSDFFRTCYLYREGGVYMDTGFTTFVPLRNIIEENDTFISAEDNRRSEIPKNEKPETKTSLYYLHNAFMAAEAKNPILERHISIMIENIETRNYCNDSHSITGPGALGRAFKEVCQFFDIGTFSMKDHEGKDGQIKIFRSVYYPFIGTAFISPEIDLEKVKTNPYFLSKTLTYRWEQRKYSRPYYGAYYKQRQVFGEEGVLTFGKKEIEPNLTPRFEKLVLTYPSKKGMVKAPSFIPAAVKMSYSQEIPKNIIQFGLTKEITENMDHCIKTFVYLNPEYDYYYIVEENLKRRQEIASEMGGFIINPEMVCMIPLRDFINPTVTCVVSKKFYGIVKGRLLTEDKQFLHEKKSLYSKATFLTDGQEYGGVSNRVLSYMSYNNFEKEFKKLAFLNGSSGILDSDG